MVVCWLNQTKILGWINRTPCFAKRARQKQILGLLNQA
jgi:hypothetical protein